MISVQRHIEDLQMIEKDAESQIESLKLRLEFWESQKAKYVKALDELDQTVWTNEEFVAWKKSVGGEK